MPALGPVDPLRSISAQALLPLARTAGAAAGVTRLADITRLDRLGLPVWQAVRPMSRALSAHQGKGATDADAQVGALMEAFESSCAESFEEEGPWCRLDELPVLERAAEMADFAADRRDPPAADQTYRWVAAENPMSGRRLHLPFDLVSLDLTQAVPSRFDRASNGVATAATRGEAIAVALQELIERDAVIEWQAGGMLACAASVLEVDTVPFDWFSAWIERLDAERIAARFYAVPSVTESPVFLCELVEGSEESAPYRGIQGRGCHAVPEIALFKALAEALQARATFIAGAREDLRAADYAKLPPATVTISFGLPLGTGMAGVAWEQLAPGPRGADDILAALEAAGYREAAIVDLGQAGPLATVRAFVPGLGSLHRRRRPAA